MISSLALKCQVKTLGKSTFRCYSVHLFQRSLNKVTYHGEFIVTQNIFLTFFYLFFFSKKMDLSKRTNKLIDHENLHRSITEISDKVVPSKISDNEMPPKTSEIEMPTELSDKKVFPEISDKKVPPEISDKVPDAVMESKWKHASFDLDDYAKGQLISECLFDVSNFQKTNKKFDKFLPKNLKSGQIIR